MSITEYAIKNNRVTLVALFIIFISAILIYFKMPRAEDPGFIVRTAVVSTYMPGASPYRMEQLITDKIEKAIQEMPEVDSIDSESRTGVSVVSVNIKPEYVEMTPIWDELRRKVEEVAPFLPQGATFPEVDDDLGDVFGIILSITGEGFNYADIEDIADSVRDEILRLEDVAKVEIKGAQEQRIFVEFHHARLAEMGLSPQQLIQTLSSRNIIDPGGSVTTGDERIVLEPTGNYESIEDLKQTIIKSPISDELLYLGDITHIFRGYIDPPAVKMRTNNGASLALAVSMRKGGNITRLGEQINTLIPRFEEAYPLGVEFDWVAFQPELVSKTVNDFVVNLLQAIAVVTLVMLVSLGLRTGIVVASLIPGAILMSIMLMGYLDIGLDQVSLAALIIALGMLVDNAIVMVESILVDMRSGKKAVQAAIDSAAELRVPLLTSSLTTIAAFLPIYLAESETGEYTAPLFKVVAITLLSSWFLALTMIPLFSSYIIRVKQSGTGASGETVFASPFYTKYRNFLGTLLRRPYFFTLILSGLFVLVMMMSAWVPKLFFPPSDRPQFAMELEFPLGTDITKTEAMIKQTEAFMQETLVVKNKGDEGVVNWGAFIGEGPPLYYLGATYKTTSPEFSYIITNTTSDAVIQSTIERLERFFWDEFPDLKATLKRLDYGPPVDYPIAIRIMGRAEDKVFDIVNALKRELSNVAGTKNISDDWGLETKKLLVRVSQPRARRAGLTSEDIATSLQAGLEGIELTQFREGDEIIPVILRSVAADRDDIDKLESLSVFAQTTGRSVPLKQVADVNTTLTWEPAKILRRDRLKTVTVTSELQQKVTANDVITKVLPWLEAESKKWPPGYRFELGGEAEESAKANDSIVAKLPIAGFIILFLLVMQFNSIRKPIIILVTIPLGLMGVILGLLATNSYMGFMTFLGIISLAGIVINNAIVLLDRIQHEITELGRSPQDAIIEAAQRRLRPILLTTATTVGGLIPLWVSGGAMWEPMAIAIIFGLLFATLLTLGFVPMFYALLYRVSFKNYEYTLLDREKI